MALIFGVFDPDTDRRALMRNRLPQSLAGLPNLRRQHAASSCLDIYWEASASTPVSVANDRLSDRERMAFVLGDFDAPYALQSDAASRLLRRTADESPDRRCLSGQNGYYLALLFDDAAGIALGTDAIGLFPLYYWAQNDVFLFGTSPGLFKLHPLFVAEPSVDGMASVLLISHISGGQSLFKGVRRSGSGHLVTWSPQQGVRETLANPVRMTDASFDLPYETCLARVGACFDAFHKPLASLRAIDISMSGGQDSRMVAGYAAKYVPATVVRAVSVGTNGDRELQYARMVWRVLGWQHRYQDAEFEKWPWFAKDQLRLESLQGPLASFEVQTQAAMLSESGGPFLSGYFGNTALGDRESRASLSEKSGLFGFGELFRKLSAYGFGAADAAELLLGHEGQQSLAGVVNNLKQEWDCIDALPFQKTWHFYMTTRNRFHLGSMLWRLSLGAWPLLPYVDRRLLDAMASMPLDYFHDRRMQADLIKREFPRLATLPLDRNAQEPDYLVRTPYRKFADALPSVADVSWRLHRWLERGRERRYYYRIFDYNNPGWKLVRQEADGYRNQASPLLNSDAVNRFLPAADAEVKFGARPIVEASKTKTLAGLVLWNGLNFGKPLPASAPAAQDA